MLTKILLVATLIIISWNSFTLSDANKHLRSQTKEIVEKNKSLNEQLIKNQNLLESQTITLQKNSKSHSTALASLQGQITELKKALQF